MLAVQSVPRMASSRRESSPFLPFGYSIDENQEPLPAPPEPAPGNPVLSETDTLSLSTFFQDFAADQYNTSSFDGGGLHFSDTWLELPHLVGTTTSFGQQPGPHLASPSTPNVLPPHHSQNGFHNQNGFSGQNGFHNQIGFQNFLSMGSMLPPPPPPPPPTEPQSHGIHEHTPDDVLNAAATLIHNPSTRRHHSVSGDGSVTRRSAGVPVGHLRHQPLEEFKEDGQRGSAPTDDEHIFKHWMFGNPGQSRPRNAPPPDVQYGSDSSFSHTQGFTPSSYRETAESLSNEQLKTLECLEPTQSADNTRPSSPNHADMSSITEKLSAPAARLSEIDTPPRKRRKSKNSKELPTNQTTATPLKTASGKKSKGKQNGTASPSVEASSTAKRRKSAVAASKPPRENLTDDQKRENHIRSEQKRRNLIKEGYEDMCILVPGLHGGGFSKSTILSMTYDWLADLVKGNRELETQLRALQPLSEDEEE